MCEYSILTMMSDVQRSTFIDTKGNEEQEVSSKIKCKEEEFQFNDNQSMSTSSSKNISSVSV